jgi:hypothetical protein
MVARGSKSWEIYLDLVARGSIVLFAIFIGVQSVMDITMIDLSSPVGKIISIIAGIGALYLCVRRDYYLPFLGKMVYPCGSLSEKTPLKADTSVRIITRPNANIVYWASESSDNADVIHDNPWLAYDLYANTGVVRSDVNGVAVLKFRRPSSYKTPGFMKRVLPAHVHYRVCDENGGMVGRVETMMVKH